MRVFHAAITVAGDYLTRRERYRKAHIERFERLRETGVVIGGGPAADGGTADIVYRATDGGRLARLIEADPYWRGGVWKAYASRSFRFFVDRLVAPPIVLDGTRRLTVVEGSADDATSAPDALLMLREAGRVEFGGILDDGRALALVRSASVDEAIGWLAGAGGWDPARFAARPLLYVL